jgi:hypothetical protein
MWTIAHFSFRLLLAPLKICRLFRLFFRLGQAA